MYKKYQSYQASDFLKDESFKRWALNLTPELDEHWENWLKAYPEKREIVLRAKEIILSLSFAEYLPSQEVEDAVYERVMARSRASVRSVPARRRFPSWGVAASLVLLLAVGWGVWHFAAQQDRPAPQVATTEPWLLREAAFGEKLQVKLPDGSTVKLNAGSRLYFPAYFGKLRELRLEGEAFFDVATDPDRPFVVRTGDVETRVLGTAFNLNHDAASGKVAVVVAHGKVRVQHGKQPAEAVELLPEEKATFDPQAESLHKSKADLERETAWKDGIIIFEEASLAEIAEVIERWYGYKVVVRGSAGIPRKFTGKFDNKTLRALLDKLTYTSAISYSIEMETKTVYLRTQE